MPHPFDTVEQAKDVVQGWKAFDENFKVGDLTCAALEAEVNKAIAQQDKIDALEKQAIDERNERDTDNGELWEKVKRVRNTVKGLFGDDSSQYQLVGGTRLSDKKKPAKKATPTTTTTPTS
ncbi:MAG: hypothetical protein WA821_21530 [Anaerolineales bacterium]